MADAPILASLLWLVQTTDTGKGFNLGPYGGTALGLIAIAWGLMRWIARTSREVNRTPTPLSMIQRPPVSGPTRAALIERGITAPELLSGLSEHDAQAMLLMLAQPGRSAAPSAEATASSKPTFSTSSVTRDPSGLTVIRHDTIAMPELTCPVCRRTIDLAGRSLPVRLNCPGCGGEIRLSLAGPDPTAPSG